MAAMRQLIVDEGAVALAQATSAAAGGAGRQDGQKGAACQEVRGAMLPICAKRVCRGGDME